MSALIEDDVEVFAERPEVPVVPFPRANVTRVRIAIEMFVLGLMVVGGVLLLTRSAPPKDPFSGAHIVRILAPGETMPGVTP